MRRALVGVALLLVGAHEARAAALTLNDAQKKQAVLVGERSIASDAFDAEWRVKNGSGDTVTVLTPFHRVVIAARHAAFRREPLKPGERDKLLKQEGGRLVLWVQLRGRSEEFARFYEPRLHAGERSIKPTFVQNERTAARQEDGAYVARCVYGFSVRELTGTSKVALVIGDADGREVSRFSIDLSTMR